MAAQCCQCSWRINAATETYALSFPTRIGSIADLRERVPFRKDELRRLAEVGALNALAAHRRDALWQVERELLPMDDLFAHVTVPVRTSPLAPMTLGERVRADFRGLGLTTGRHPMALIRDRIPDAWRASDLAQVRNNQPVRIAGAVICRQRPGTAHGILFLSLEDETGIANAIITPEMFERQRLMFVEEAFLSIEGTAQVHEGIIHIRARRADPLLSAPLAAVDSHDFH